MPINFKREISGSIENTVNQLTEALKTQGFGVLTRIDLHKKFEEKLGKNIAPVVVLGACNPQMAFEAYARNTDVASLIPCNAVVRDIGNNKVSVELVKPSSLMQITGDDSLVQMTKEADKKLDLVIRSLC